MRRERHMVEVQREQESAFLRKFRTGSYSLENPLVIRNPYGIAPLTALVMFTTEKETQVTVTVKGKEKEGDIRKEFPAGREHILPVLGLYADWNNRIELRLSDGEEQVIGLKTEPAPEAVKKASYIRTTPEYMGDRMMFLVPAMGAVPAAYDYRGDCRWYCTENLTFAMKRLRNGRISIGTSRLTEKPYYTTGLAEMDLIGKIYCEYRLPGGYHHDQFEMEDGNLLVLTEDFSRGTVEDLCVLIDRRTGTVLKTWDLRAVLPQNAAPSGSWSAHDWFHNNALWYDKATDSITFSGRHQDVLVNLDYSTGAINWILGDPEGWPEDIRENYFLRPEGNLEWQYEQHACLITPDGDVMTFDNGHYRSKNREHYLQGKDNYSRGVRYSVDRETRTVRQVWQYGKERGCEFFSPYISNVDYYGEGHYMVHSGGIASLDGVTCEGVGSRRYFENKNVKLESKTVELKDGKVVYELHLPANYYRAKKLALYGGGEELTLGAGILLGTLGKTPEFGTDAETTGTEKGLPEKYHLSITEEIDRYVFRGTFEKGQLVMLSLEDDCGARHSYFISTSAQSFTAMCVGTFQSTERQVEFKLNKEGLNGRYRVFLTVDEIRYDAETELVCREKTE